MSIESFSNELQMEQLNNTDLSNYEELFDRRVEVNEETDLQLGKEENTSSFDPDKRVDVTRPIGSKDNTGFDPDRRVEVVSSDSNEDKPWYSELTETMHTLFEKIDSLFNHGDVSETSIDDEIQMDVLDAIIADRSFDESIMAVTYFMANKIGVSQFVTEMELDGFRNSQEREEYVKEVKAYVGKNNAFSDGWSNLVGSFESAQETLGEWVDSFKDKVSDTVDNISDNLSKDKIEVGVDNLAGSIVDAAKLLGYYLGRFNLGVFQTLEDTHDYVAGSLTAIFNKELATDIVQNNITDVWTEKLNEVFDVDKVNENFGDKVDTFGEESVDLALSILAVFGGPIPSAIALGAMFLENSGEKLRNLTSETGVVDSKAIFDATLTGFVKSAAFAIMKPLNAFVLGKGAGSIASGLSKIEFAGSSLSTALGGRLTGILSMAVLGGADSGLMRFSDMISSFSDAALGYEDGFDAIKEVKDTLISIAGGAFIGGFTYFGMDFLRSSTMFQRLFGVEYTPDYFQNLYANALKENILSKVNISNIADVVDTNRDYVDLYYTNEWKGYGDQNYYYNDYRYYPDTNTIEKIRCNDYKFFDGSENSWYHDETLLESWVRGDVNIPAWLVKYLPD